MSSSGISYTAPKFSLEQYDAEIKSMTPDERKRYDAEIFGTAPPIHETDEIIDSSIRVLAQELENIESKVEYDTALEQCPAYVTSRKFQLLFLRVEDFNAAKAACRIVRFWAWKKELFKERAFRKLTIDDLKEEDIEFGKSGALLLLPNCDEAGRAIFIGDRPSFKFKDYTSVLRWMFYTAMVALEDESVQRNGVIGCEYSFHPFSPFKQFHRKLDSKMFRQSFEIIPMRVMAFHYWVDSRVLERVVLPIWLFLLGPKMRARFRIHPGSRKHLAVEDLKPFGLSAEILPTHMGGTYTVDMSEWIQQRRSMGL